ARVAGARWGENRGRTYGTDASLSLSTILFERGYRGFVFQDVADFIESLKDASLGEGIDWKSASGASLDKKCLGGEIDRYRGAGLQQAVSLGIHNNREQSVF